MSELQNENTEVMVSEDVDSTTPATEESKDDSSLGKLGIALIGLAAVGTLALGKAAVKRGKKLVDKINEKRADLKRFKDSKDAGYSEAETEDDTEEDQDETEDEK